MSYSLKINKFPLLTRKKKETSYDIDHLKIKICNIKQRSSTINIADTLIALFPICQTDSISIFLLKATLLAWWQITSIWVHHCHAPPSIAILCLNMLHDRFLFASSPYIPDLLMAAKDFKALVLHVSEVQFALPKIPTNSPQSRIALVIKKKSYQNTKT